MASFRFSDRGEGPSRLTFDFLGDAAVAHSLVGVLPADGAGVWHLECPVYSAYLAEGIAQAQPESFWDAFFFVDETA